MASISTDGEGTISKRPRRHSPSPSPRTNPTPPPQQQQMEDKEEEEEEEEEEEDEENKGEQEEEGDEVVEEEEGESESEREASLSKPHATRKSTFIGFHDIEVLDCSICMEALSIPVLQCRNGHMACSSCYKELAKQCASCEFAIGCIRNWAIERVLESVIVSCQNEEYGCRENFAYSKKREHKKDCLYVPIRCPVTECNFNGSCSQLHRHFTRAHSTSVIHFRHSFIFTIPIFFRDTNVCLILQDHYGVSFILHHKVEVYGNAIAISCLRPSSSKTKYSYFLGVSTGHGSSLKFDSYTKNIGSCFDQWPTSAEFLLIPRNFFLGTPEQLSLSVSINR